MDTLPKLIIYLIIYLVLIYLLTVAPHLLIPLFIFLLFLAATGPLIIFLTGEDEDP